MKELKKLIDLKSIVTLLLIATLVLVVFLNREIEEKLFLLFSNITTSVVTYYFAKNKSNENIDK